MSLILDNLNEFQRRAVMHVDGPMLTLAGPGSGKTRVVTHRIAYLMEQGVSPHSILALTFTNKAAQEMRRRLRTLVGDTSVWMGTFHGYCARFLRQYGRLVGLPENFSIWDPSDAKIALKAAVQLSGVSLSHLNEEGIAREISRLKNKLVTPEVAMTELRGHREQSIIKVYPHYQQELLKCGACDFDCLLLHTAMILRCNPELRAELDAKHRYILVDEYQDTNLAQYVIVRGLSVDFPNLNVTGDPDQSIYGWRGASIDNILKFEQDYQNVSVVRLEENYRSTPEILAAADCLIQNNSRRKAKTLIPTRGSGTQVRLHVYASAGQEAKHIVEQIQTSMIDEGTRASDFAVLYRTNAHSRLLEKELLARRIGYQLIGGFRFYQRQEIKDLLSYLMLVHNPSDDVAFQRVVNVPVRGVGQKSIEKLALLGRQTGVSMIEAARLSIKSGLISGKAVQGVKKFLELYDELVEYSKGPIASLLTHLIQKTDYVNYLQSRKVDAPDDSVQENTSELLADAMEVDQLYPEGGGLEHFLEQTSLAADTDQYESTSERVTLMTMHAAKGLEFPTVYIIAIEQNVLPHSRSMEDPDQYEEERRLFFVGITRAKNHLQLSMAKRRGFGEIRSGEGKLTVPSPFLMELPRSDMNFKDFASGHGNWPGDYEEDLDAWDESSASMQRREGGQAEYDDRFDPMDGLDESCQLPPDELAGRLSSTKRKKKMDIATSFQRGSQFANNAASMTSSDGFELGTVVCHPDYGVGRILSVEGRGPKRLARVLFIDTGTKHSFYLSRSKLTIHDDALP